MSGPDPLHIPAGERGVLRLFNLNIEAGDLKALRAPRALEAALGLQGLDHDHVDLIALSDLGEMGLSEFLSEGYATPEDQLAPARDRLDALKGQVLLIRSAAFGQTPATLSPAAQLRFVGQFSEPQTDWSGAAPIDTASAKRGSGPPLPPRAARSRARRIGGMVFAVFMLLVLAIVLLVVL